MILPAFSKTYDRRRVLDFPGLELQPGKIYGIIGANGSGKSTFAKILAGAEQADKRIRLTGIRVGYMPQKNYAFRLSTRANLLLGGSDAAKADALLDAFRLRHLEKKRADRLSGGETARMALARLMMKSFNLVILDEPTAPMDMEATAIAEQMILDYVRQTGCTLLLVTHSLRQARRVSDEILFFCGGALTEHGPGAQVLEHPAKQETRQFLEFYGV